MSAPLRYQPDYATSPGEVLDEYLSVIGMTKAELAVRCGRPTKTISEIIHGKAAITPETALQLERVLGRPASLWQNLEAAYRLRLAEQDDHGQLKKHVPWARSFPVREMISGGCIEEPADDADLVKKMLRFFGVGSVEGWQAQFGDLKVAYRRSPSFTAAPASVSAWIRQGERLAAEIECSPYDAKAFRTALDAARRLTVESVPKVVDRLVALCAGAGVALVITPELPRTHLSGIARWLSKDKALIQLSLRHKTNDHMWFSFFHEAGHILLHGKKKMFIDEGKGGGDHVEVEAEANQFASERLIPPTDYATFIAEDDLSAASIKRFARRLGIAPGIVVGRLQYEKVLAHWKHNELKEPLTWG